MKHHHMGALLMRGEVRSSRLAASYRASRRVGRHSFLALLVVPVLVLAGCDPAHPVPARITLGGLPVSGDRALATRTGFTDCFNEDAINVRCRRHNVMFLGHGPYEAAVDLRGAQGQYGFSELTLWDDAGSDGTFDVIISLARSGWHYCYTGGEERGDQAIFTRAGEPVWVSMDISYWGKRRLRVLPNWNRRGLDQPCKPQKDLTVFGTDVARAAAGLPPLR